VYCVLESCGSVNVICEYKGSIVDVYEILESFEVLGLGLCIPALLGQK
jgi:hypothetical protein